jgi:hypothetical protein
MNAHFVKCGTYDGALDGLALIERKFCCSHHISYDRYVKASVCDWNILSSHPDSMN